MNVENSAALYLCANRDVCFFLDSWMNATFKKNSIYLKSKYVLIFAMFLLSIWSNLIKKSAIVDLKWYIYIILIPKIMLTVNYLYSTHRYGIDRSSL